MSNEILEKVKELSTPSKRNLNVTIVKLRREHKESQVDLAKALDVNVITIWRWENDIDKPSDKHLRALSEHYDVDLESYDFLSEQTAERAKLLISLRVDHLLGQPIEDLTPADQNWLVKVINLFSPNTLVEEKLTVHRSNEKGEVYEAAIKKVHQLMPEGDETDE